MNFQQQDSLLEPEEFYTLKSYIDKLSQSANIGIWEFDLTKSPGLTEWKAVNVFQLLGFTSLQPFYTFEYFLSRLVHPNDQASLFHFFENELQHTAEPSIEIQILTKSSGYRWFSVCGRAWWNEQGQLLQLMGIISGIDSRKRNQLATEQKEDLLHASAELLEAGGWETDFTTGQVSWTSGIHQLLETLPTFRPSIDNTKEFYHPESVLSVQEAFTQALKEHTSFSIDVKLVTAKGNLINARLKGDPICDKYGKCLLMRGSIQKIGNDADADLLLTNKKLTEQNKRLQNFAHIVSHNLRSYSNNLQSMTQLFSHPDNSEDDRQDCINYIKAISAGLTNAVNHLTEIVKQQDDANRKKSKLSFADTLSSITQALQSDLDTINGKVYADFKVPEVHYLSAYLDSIVLNMITNAIKYHHPDRNLIIRCSSYEQEGHVYLTIEDNGLGIDLNKHKDSLFGMYKTFHQHPDSRGLGLFMTRNQIETLGGTINVESEPGIGTKFIIKLT